MKRLALAASMIAAAAFAGTARAESAPDWSGSYGYTESGGRTTGGTGIVIQHGIAVTREAGQYMAEITANGYQTQTHIHALGTASGRKLQLRFEKNGADQRGESGFKPGMLLLELERAGGRRLLTHWGAYTPVASARFRNPGVYFKRE